MCTSQPRVQPAPTAAAKQSAYVVSAPTPRDRASGASINPVGAGNLQVGQVSNGTGGRQTFGGNDNLLEALGGGAVSTVTGTSDGGRMSTGGGATGQPAPRPNTAHVSRNGVIFATSKAKGRLAN